MFVIFITNKLKINEKLFNYLRKNKINVNLHYIPVHLQPYYRKLGFKKGNFPEAEKYYEEALSIPIYPNLKFKLQKQVADIIKKTLLK